MFILSQDRIDYHDWLNVVEIFIIVEKLKQFPSSHLTKILCNLQIAIWSCYKIKIVVSCFQWTHLSEY